MLIRVRFKGNDVFTDDELKILEVFKIVYVNEDNCYMYDSSLVSSGDYGVFGFFKCLTETLGYNDVILATVVNDPRLYEFLLDRNNRTLP